MIVIVLLIGIPVTFGFIFLAVSSGKTAFSPKIIFKNLKKGQVLPLQEGSYALWGESTALKKNRLFVENPVILSSRHEKIPIFYGFGGMHATSLDGTGRGLLYSFTTQTDEYVFDIENIPFAKYPLGQHLPIEKEKMCSVKYSIRKKSSPLYYVLFFLGIFGSVASLVATIILTSFLAAGIL